MRKHSFISAIYLALSLFFAGCSVNPSKVDAEYAKDFIDKATFVKSKTGMCFAIIATRMTASTEQNGVSFTWVPCEMAAAYLEK